MSSANATAETVKRVVNGLRLSTPGGALKRIDSMGLIDLVVALENAFSLSIPPDRLSPDHFATEATLGNFMQELVDANQSK